MKDPFQRFWESGGKKGTPVEKPKRKIDQFYKIVMRSFRKQERIDAFKELLKLKTPTKEGKIEKKVIINVAMLNHWRDFKELNSLLEHYDKSKEEK